MRTACERILGYGNSCEEREQMCFPYRSPKKRMASRRHLLPLAWLALLTPHCAWGQLAPLEPQAFKEEFRDVTPVSGGVRVGVQTGQPDQLVDPANLSVHLTPDHGDYLCVTVNSRDARYFAELRFHIRGLPPGHYSLRLPTAYRERLSRYRTRELAVYAETKDSCSPAEPAEAVMIAAWDRDATLDSILVLINGGNTDVVRIVAITSEGKSVYFSCNPTLEGVAFNTECPVMRPAIELGAGDETRIVRWAIQRFRFDTQLMPIPLPIKVP